VRATLFVAIRPLRCFDILSFGSVGVFFVLFCL
jgi:hypothetical protein